MKQRLIFHVGHSCGFYSEFNNMVLAMVYCRQHGIDFQIYSSDAVFKHRDGWTDYFLPFCREVRNPIHHLLNARYAFPTAFRYRSLLAAYRTLHPHTLLTPDVWNSFRHIDQTSLTTNEVRLRAADIIDEIYRFNSATESEIRALINSLDIPKPYIGMHIRGGDKCLEHDIISADAFITRAEELSPIRRAFIYTDDYSNIARLRQGYPNWEFHTLASPNDHGYVHTQFIALPPAQKRLRTINMLSSMELLSQAELTLCTYSSNVGMFLGMRHGVNPIGMDFDSWLIW